MKIDHSVIVTEDLLNELGTLAAPSMLKIALALSADQLGAVYPETMALQSYSAEFKEGARKDDRVLIAYENIAIPSTDAREFRFYFSKTEEKYGRIGHWRLVFSNRGESQLLAYDISEFIAAGRSDRELWQPDPVLATGSMDKDAQMLLWLAGQSSRRYMKRLDEEFANRETTTLLQDDINTRIYAGAAVVMAFTCWAKIGEPLRCVLHHQPPLGQESNFDRKMVFAGKMIAGELEHTYLLGNFQFTVVRLSAQRTSIYPHGGATLITK